ncbi:Sec-independent protein translocase subunit TatA/TatB [Halogeometricum limi]|uniref:Sec-independent protein translocase protein TatA n=1 Tax=Halogeometricum limi TaxID=555875 RepID=A0A1I6GUD0_9EURY|nr:twin-arginine translocase TatA/TatE family subunit [Halogeometricum limi]SFR45726.1 sec-independent protein translocase protein TatA [Halogeometricum limi]
MTLTLVPLFPGIPGGPELLIVLLIVVLLFGANKLPQLARSTGQAMGEFRRGREDIERELQEAAAGPSDDTDADGVDDAGDTETTETDAAVETEALEEETDDDRTTAA